jgi:hypothetical protein
LLFPQDWWPGVAYLGNDEITYIYRLRSQDLYLGSIISTTGGTDEDIKARKRKAQQAFAMLKPVWRSTTSVCALSTSIALILLLS